MEEDFAKPGTSAVIQKVVGKYNIMYVLYNVVCTI